MERPASAAPSSSDRAELPSSCSSAEQPATSLRSFFSSAAPSSSDRAEPPSSCSSAEQPATSLRSFFSSAASRSCARAAQPAAASSRCSTAASSNSGSAAQPAREAAQPVKTLCSITDVQRWLQNNEAVLSSAAEAMRIREVVDALSSAQSQNHFRRRSNAFSSLGVCSSSSRCIAGHCRN